MQFRLFGVFLLAVLAFWQFRHLVFSK